MQIKHWFVIDLATWKTQKISRRTFEKKKLFLTTFGLETGYWGVKEDRTPNPDPKKE